MKVKANVPAISCSKRRKLNAVKSDLAVIAAQVRGQAQLDSMLMKYPDERRKVIFKAMRPHLKFDAIYPTVENTAIVTKESFAELREKYATR